MSLQLLDQSWFRAWQNLKLQPPFGLYSQLLSAYSEPQRHYHTQQHLCECFSHFSESIGEAIYPGEVEIALWFHDAIYDVKGKLNEQQSAEWAVSTLRSVGSSLETRERIAQLILATKHDAIATEPDEQLLVDIDLTILGSSPERFAEYELQVRAEYLWVPSDEYNMKRKAVLKQFLVRTSIYSTNYFRQLYEAQARSNLAVAN